MKILRLLWLFLLSASTISGQELFKKPVFVKTTIGKSGCTLDLPSEFSDKEFEMQYAPDSSLVYSGDFELDSFHYSVIVVTFNKLALKNIEEKEAMLTNYLEYLKTEYHIESEAGFERGKQMESNPDAVGVTDHWQGYDHTVWAVEAWSDSGTLAVMQLYGPETYPDHNLQTLFLNGFRFK